MTPASPRSWTADLADRDRNPLAHYYTRFRVADRVLLSGHSHQAWPDCGFEGQAQAWLDAADHVDEKWPLAAEQAEVVRDGYRVLLDDPDGEISLAASTHDLLVRLLSALLTDKSRPILTTQAEFYSARRQFLRLAEAGCTVEFVDAHPAVDVGKRLAERVEDSTCCVYLSTVFFDNARVAGDLSDLGKTCRQHGVPLILDVYHHLNVVPFSLRDLDLEDAYVLGGGYKYCQLGEGNAFLRYPPDCNLRPVITGWFADFESLTGDAVGEIRYGDPGDRFAGATYDPTSHYRAARVFRFFAEQRLDAQLLREISQRQMRRLVDGFDALDLDPGVIRRDRETDLESIGGFLALTSPYAAAIRGGLAQRGVMVDSRQDVLRLGPAPYVSRRQIEEAMVALGEVVVTPG